MLRPSTKTSGEEYPRTQEPYYHPKKKGTKNDSNMYVWGGMIGCLCSLLMIFAVVGAIFAFVVYAQFGEHTHPHIHPTHYCSLDQDGSMRLDFKLNKTLDFPIFGWVKNACKGLTFENDSMVANYDGWYRIHATARMRVGFNGSFIVPVRDMFRIYITIDGSPTDSFGESVFDDQTGTILGTTRKSSDAFIHRDVYLIKGQRLGLLLGVGYSHTVREVRNRLAALSTLQEEGVHLFVAGGSIISSFLDPLPADL